MRNEAPRAARQGRMACVGCGAPVGHNNMKYTREMCLRCYARLLNGQPVGGRDDNNADPHSRQASSDDDKRRG